MESNTLDIRLPDLGDVGTARIVEWLRPEGALVKEGEDLIEVETQKTTFVVPAPATGRLVEIAVAPGGDAHAGDQLGRLECVEA